MDTLFRHTRHFIQRNASYENGVLVVALLIASSLVWNTVGALGKNFELQQRVDLLATEIDLFKLENETLEFQKKYYESDEYIELSARERLGKSLPGEKVLILPPVKAIPEEKDTAQPARISDRSNFDQWMYFFFGDKSR
jgi:cell division protein FtsB